MSLGEVQIYQEHCVDKLGWDEYPCPTPRPHVYYECVSQEETSVTPWLFRNLLMWRVPAFHLSLRRVHQIELHPCPKYLRPGEVEVMTGEQVVVYLGLQIDHQATNPTVVDQLPEGCELCQRCVEQYLFEQRRKGEQSAPDRSAYNEYTQIMMERSGLMLS